MLSGVLARRMLHSTGKKAPHPLVLRKAPGFDVEVGHPCNTPLADITSDPNAFRVQPAGASFYRNNFIEGNPCLSACADYLSVSYFAFVLNPNAQRKHKEKHN